jgi:hypothetical protein
MSTVKIYKVTITKGYMMREQGEGFSLNPWNGNNVDYEGFDDGGKEYILPEGYEIATGNDEQQHIYDANGNYCELVKYNNCPAIITDSQYPLILKEEKDDRVKLIYDGEIVGRILTNQSLSIEQACELCNIDINAEEYDYELFSLENHTG